MSDIENEYVKSSKLVVKKKSKRKNVSEDYKENRAQRINFKNYIRDLREQEIDDEYYSDDDYN